MTTIAKSQVELTVSGHEHPTKSNEPVTCGIPWPKGELKAIDNLRLFDSEGKQIPLQASRLDAWPDGSVRWSLLDWQATKPGLTKYNLTADGEIPKTNHVAPLTIEESKGKIEVNSSDYRFCFGTHFEPNTLATITYRNTTHKVTLSLADRQSASVSLKVIKTALLERGPLRTCIQVVGVADFGTQPMHVFAEAHCFSDTNAIRWQVTLRNPEAADHPGGMWDLGAKSSLLLKDASICIDTPSKEASTYAYSAEIGSDHQTSTLPITIYQDSSGGENWKSSIHINRDRKIPLRFRGYQVQVGEKITSDLRATPTLSIHNNGQSIGITMPHFWQNFPKTLEGTPEGVRLGLFPKEHDDLHEIQGGEQKTHSFLIGFGENANGSLEWGRNPSIARAEPTWYAASGAIPYLTPKSQDPHKEYLALVDAAIEGNDTFEMKREVIDEYGWRHFGDIYGDHEAVFHQGNSPLVSHYNNQYDPVVGFGLQFLRSGDKRWFNAMNELASHVIDIDIYHTTKDKSAYNHGLFWHTFHYVDADTAHHRTYPKNGKVPPKGGPVPGGGPANEQNYAAGFVLHHFLTGSHISKENAIGMAQWVLDMDDGRKTIFRWLAGGSTGLASQSRSEDYHGPGRGAANSVLVLLDGFRISGERRFLTKAEELIRRVIHPTDHVASKIALRNDPKTIDAENRWFYTMFLQALGVYLDVKVDLNELDEQYAYSRTCLLHYARWMAETEYLTLDKPEVLEYPTETWAAQDMRKSEVFTFALLHSKGTERDKFKEKANYFFQASVDSLSKFPTKTLCRPVVLMLRYGWMHNWLKEHGDEYRAQPNFSGEFGAPMSFEPQKARAKKNLKKVIAATGVMGFALVVAIAIAWLR